MARLAGVDLPRNKRMIIALTYIYGIGPATSKKILEKTGISEDLRTDDLTENEGVFVSHQNKTSKNSFSYLCIHYGRKDFQ